jgi:hypothetical protein
MNIEGYRNKLYWSRAELARQAGIDYGAASNAEEGGWITLKTAGALINALNRGFKRLGVPEIDLSEIEGLRIKGVTK